MECNIGKSYTVHGMSLEKNGKEELIIAKVLDNLLVPNVSQQYSMLSKVPD